MSRVPSGPSGPGGHGLPPMYYPGGPGGVPPGPPPGPPQPQLYVDPYAQYRGMPPQSPFPPDGHYNAAAGPSRDPYSTPTSAGPRSVSGGGGGPMRGPVGGPSPQQVDPPSRHASWHKNDVFDQNGKEIASGHSTQQAGPSEFIKKLYKMLEDESAQYGRGKPAGTPRSKGERGSVGWGRGGTSFVVWDMNEFTTKILPQTFRHSNFSSFVRQLNKYGFSKIKHVDEETGQIKENVWEFQHPNFQSGGKADLDSIKRKAVVPKKAAQEEAEASPARGLTNEDQSRMMDMLNRIIGLEDVLYKTNEQLTESRHREVGLLNLLREVVGHLNATEKERPTNESSAGRINSIIQMYDQAHNALIPTPHPGYIGGVPPGPPGNYQAYNTRPMPYKPPAPPYPNPNMAPLVSPLQSAPPKQSGARAAPAAHVSPRMDGSRGSKDRQSPLSASQAQPPPSSTAGPSGQRRDRPPKEETIDIPQQQQQQGQQHPMMGGGGGQWMPDPPNGAARTSLRFMVDTMPAGGATVVPIEEGSMDATSSAASAAAMAATGVSAAAASVAAAAAAESEAAKNAPSHQQQSNASAAGGAGQQTNANGAPLRQVARPNLKPSWTQTPRILVVEDDVVYRQLSSKFLEKFGCVVETAENAQQGVEKMNQTKYDLVLMDISFGPTDISFEPSMDGRKATSLIRQFDIYTPIISMTSNVQTSDVDSYLQSGMNDVLAKPFTKQHLFCILDKHLIHLKAIQLSAEVPRFLGLPPLSDQGVVDAITTSAQQWETNGGDVDSVGNPLAGNGWSDDTYQLVLQQFLTTGVLPDQSSMASGSATATFSATSILFPDTTGFSRKRTIEAVAMDGDWEEQAKRHQPLPVGTVTELA